MARSSYDDFEFKERIGSGSFGVVWRALRKQDAQEYAIKEIDLEGLGQKEQEECIRETQVLALLDSPHIIRYYDSFLLGGRLFIVTEYAKHGNLHDAIKASEQPLQEAVVWRLLLQTLLGLHHMHSRKILHRDVKTLNIFLDADSNVKIGDMGVARVMSSKTSFVQTIVGTPYYLSPELCEDRPYNEKSDVWALGVVLYECCTKRHPFDADNQGALILKILRGRFPPVTGYSRELTDVISSCLTQDVRRRPDTGRLLAARCTQDKAAALGIELPVAPSPATVARMLLLQPPPASASPIRVPSSSSSRPPSGKPSPRGVPSRGSSAKQLVVPPPVRRASASQLVLESGSNSKQQQAHIGQGIIRLGADFDDLSALRLPIPSAPPSSEPSAYMHSGGMRSCSQPGSRRASRHSDSGAAGGRLDLAVVGTGYPAGAAPAGQQWHISGSGKPSPRISNSSRSAPASPGRSKAGGDAITAAAGMPQQLLEEPAAAGYDGVLLAGGKAMPAAAMKQCLELQAANSHISAGDEANVLLAEADAAVAQIRLSAVASGIPTDTYGNHPSSSDLVSPSRDVRAGMGSLADRSTHMRQAAQLLRAACVDLVGRPAFDEVYALMKMQADADGDGGGESVTELSRQVFRIIPYSKSEAVPLLYRLFYSEAQLGE